MAAAGADRHRPARPVPAPLDAPELRLRRRRRRSSARTTAGGSTPRAAARWSLRSARADDPARGAPRRATGPQRYGLVWVALDEPPGRRCRHPRVGLRGRWSRPGCPRRRGHAAPRQFTDNFLDFAHFPFVHTGTFGADEILRPRLEVETDRPGYAVEPIDATGSRVRYEHHDRRTARTPLVATGEHAAACSRGAWSYVYRVALRRPAAPRVSDDRPRTTRCSSCRPGRPVDHAVHGAAAKRPRRARHAGARRGRGVRAAVLAEDLASSRASGSTPDSRSIRPLQVHTRVDRNTVEFRRLPRRHLDPADPTSAPEPLDQHPTLGGPDPMTSLSATPLPHLPELTSRRRRLRARPAQVARRPSPGGFATLRGLLDEARRRHANASACSHRWPLGRRRARRSATARASSSRATPGSKAAGVRATT